jgi:hypothetical protein
MLKMYQNWKSIFTLNLSHNKDKDFKLAQILESGDYGLIFDIRQTFKGRRTKAGIAFLVAEFEWFKNVLISTEKKIFTLEHGNRTIKVDKRMDEVLITLIRADNTERKLMLEPEEIIKLLKTINDIEYKLISRALELEIPTKFSEFNYVNQYIE